MGCGIQTTYSDIVCYYGNPNTFVAGTLGEVCQDTSTGNIYACTTAGNAASAVWTLIGVNCFYNVNYGWNNNCQSQCSCNQIPCNCNTYVAPCPPPLPGPQGPLTPVIPIPITQFPAAYSLANTAIVPIVQGGISMSATIAQIAFASYQYFVLFYAGNPNGHVAGLLGQLCLDTTDDVLYVCTTAGTASLAVWTYIGGTFTLVPPSAGGTGVSNPTAHTIPIAEGSSNFNFLPLTNGQTLIGSTGLDPVPALITGSNGIIIDAGPGTLNIRSTSAGSNPVNVTVAGNYQMHSNETYLANASGGKIAFILPTSSLIGDMVRVIGVQNGWYIYNNNGQQQILLSVSTSVGTGGVSESTNPTDCLTLICTTANTVWEAFTFAGNILYV